MNKNKVNEALTWIFALLPLVLVAVVYAQLPEKIVMQWGPGGTTRYDAKWELWLVAGLSPLMLLLLRVMPKIDPKKRNYAKFGASYRVFQMILMLFMLIMIAVVVVEAFYPGTLDVGVVVTLMMGVLFLFLGNIMPRFRHNYFCGIKTPWTLASETVWNKANRLGGRLFFAVGVLMLPSVLLAEKLRFVLMLVLIAIVAIVPCVMSYVWFKNEQEQSNAD